MISLEFKYVDFLRHNLMLLNEDFTNAYRLYQQKHPQDLEYEFYYDEELIVFMIKMLRQGNSFEFSDYDKLDNLFEYIHMLLYWENKEILSYKVDNLEIASKEHKSDYLNEISDYAFDDSYLLKFEVYNQKEICKFFFYNVIVYGDKRMENLHDVEEADNIKADNIELIFKGVKDIKVKGSFNFEFIDYSRIYSWKHYKVSDRLYGLAILCITNYEHFIIEIIYSSINAESFEYDDSKFQFQM